MLCLGYIHSSFLQLPQRCGGVTHTQGPILTPSERGFRPEMLHPPARFHRREAVPEGNGGALYRAYAVVCHHGGMAGGHYTTYLRHDHCYRCNTSTPGRFRLILDYCKFSCAYGECIPLCVSIQTA